jgi:predicted GNAT family acetyltransferase
MKYLYTDGKNADFIKLCVKLDEYLNKLARGEENRKEYIKHNKLNDIHDVIVAYKDKNPVACASFKHIKNDIAEIKRVYVKDEFRGKGIAKTMMGNLESAAKEKGYKSLILETGRDMSSAVGFYLSLGYFVIPNYGQYKNMDKSVCMKKEL